MQSFFLPRHLKVHSQENTGKMRTNHFKKVWAFVRFWTDFRVEVRDETWMTVVKAMGPKVWCGRGRGSKDFGGNEQNMHGNNMK